MKTQGEATPTPSTPSTAKSHTSVLATASFHLILIDTTTQQHMGVTQVPSTLE